MEKYSYISESWPINVHSDFYEYDKENPNQYWVHKHTQKIYKVKCRSKWCLFKFCYCYKVSLIETNKTNKSNADH